MPAKLYVVQGSHPCATVMKALDMKGIAYKVREIPPPSHVAIVRAMFPARTVPALKLESGEKLQGSRAILARLDELAPSPALLPADPEQARLVLEAERWGDEVLQPLGRTITWPTLKAHPENAPSYTAGGQLPMPGAVAKRIMPVIARMEMRINGDESARARDLAALPGYLDKIDAWIADGVMGGEQVNRADLQIGSTLALLMTFDDLRAIIGPRPAGQLADRLFTAGGHMPVGCIPASLLPQAAASAG